MRRLVLPIALVISLLGATAAEAGRIPVTEDRIDGTKRVISLAAEKPSKRYRVTVVFMDNRQKVVRWMRSGRTIRIEVGDRAHSLQIRCIPKKKKPKP
jgi:hypothetical protein